MDRRGGGKKVEADLASGDEDQSLTPTRHHHLDPDLSNESVGVAFWCRKR